MDAELARAVLPGDLPDGGLHPDAAERTSEQLAKEGESGLRPGNRVGVRLHMIDHQGARW
ncbi:hypothetical protein AHiyo8_61700 [Arthrobacter sp. Hiyo8]|nr:hypothetical protein AHiyo8_61700 [Arthrobacter sp. Hiyo8]